jgi:hypothetical chaperone protein
VAAATEEFWIMKSHTVVGLDFGTTNSAIAVAERKEGAVLATFKDGARSTTSYRSILYFPTSERGLKREAVKALGGPDAINAYLEADTKGRLIVSIKSYLASDLFTSTGIYGRRYLLEELISIVLRNLRSAVIEQFDSPARTAVIGRPVHFAGATGDDGEALALRRLKAAAELAGFEEIVFELEPIAAAYQYERQLDHDELVLIGDFGGGTSDFTLMHLGPGRRISGNPRAGVLGTDGLPIAGDAFDSTIMMHVVAPMLGMRSHYVSLGKKLSVPIWIYSQLSSWHQMSFLKDPKTMNVLRQVKNQAEERKKIEALIYIISDNLGYELYRAVEQTKLELTKKETTTFLFEETLVNIEELVERWQFESWIQEHVDSIDSCVTRLLATCNVSAADVDSVFLTGGSSLVPLVRRMFGNKFGSDRLRSGEELTTVAKGLALAALDRF